MAGLETPLSSDEKAQFQHLIDLFSAGHPDDYCLMRTEFDGQPVAVIAALQPTPDGGVGVFPLAILTNEAMFKRLTPPDGGEEIIVEVEGT